MMAQPSSLTPHVLLLMSYSSCLTPHVLRLMSYASCLTPHAFRLNLTPLTARRTPHAAHRTPHAARRTPPQPQAFLLYIDYPPVNKQEHYSGQK